MEVVVYRLLIPLRLSYGGQAEIGKTQRGLVIEMRWGS